MGNIALQCGGFLRCTYRNCTNLNEASHEVEAALFELLERHGDAAFPHAPDTAEELLRLFRMGRAGRSIAVEDVHRLVPVDPGFAFNLARILFASGLPLSGGGAAVDLRRRLEDFNVLRAVTLLAPIDRQSDCFAGVPKVGAAYRRISRTGSFAAQEVARSSDVPSQMQDTAMLMALRTTLGFLGIAVAAGDAAAPVLKGGAMADAVCEQIFGFGLSQFAAALNEGYGLPEASNPLYPPSVREAVGKACAAASEATTRSTRRSPGVSATT